MWMLGTDLGVARATACFTFPHLDPQPDLFCLKSAILELPVTNTQQPPAFWGVVTFDTVLAPKPVTSGLARAPTSPRSQYCRTHLQVSAIPLHTSPQQVWANGCFVSWLHNPILILRECLILWEIFLKIKFFLTPTIYCSKWSSKIMKMILIKKINLDTCYTCGPLMVFSSV